MASAMASLIAGTNASFGLHTQCASERAPSRGLRLPQSATRGVFIIRSVASSSLSSQSQLRMQWSSGGQKFGSGEVLVSGRRVDRRGRFSATRGVAVCLASYNNPQVSNGAATAAAVLSRAFVEVAVVAEAVVRAAQAVGRTLTATPLPTVHSSAEKELVAALKGRLVLAAGPLLFAAISQTPGSVSTPLTVVASGMAKWLELYSGVLMVRVLLSWFPNIPWERQPLQAVRDMCDPYLNLFRNIIPPLFNALDLSPMLAFMVLGVLTSILNTTAR